ncbi:MAG TPA: hypothetical protein VJ438_06145 [Candidatus Nanoarchaeia archaeon]|nr:hypothetical protein [Candidatus Nanoarchaeia archaeon]
MEKIPLEKSVEDTWILINEARERNGTCSALIHISDENGYSHRVCCSKSISKKCDYQGSEVKSKKGIPYKICNYRSHD